LALGLSFEYADDEADVILRTQREVPDAAEPVNEVIEAGERVVLLMMLAKTTSATRRGALLDELKERLLAQTATTVRVKLEPRWDPDGSPLKLDGVGELIESVLANQSPASRMSAAGLWPVARLGMRHPMCIVELLDDENAGVQVAALNALRSASGLPAEVLDRVVHLLVAGDRDVRLAAKYVLREVNEPEMREWLARLVASILEQDPTSSAARGLLRDLVERA
jgi:hypothetical protein